VQWDLMVERWLELVRLEVIEEEECVATEMQMVMMGLSIQL